MKAIFLLVILSLISLQLNAEEREVEGAFGIKLGEAIDVSQLENLNSSLNGINEYTFTPDNPYMPLTDYAVFVDPGSNRVYEIVAKGGFGSMKRCKIELRNLEKALSRKYIKTSKKISDEFGGIPKISFGKTSRKIIAICTGGILSKELVLTYVDQDIEKVAKKEIKKKLQKDASPGGADDRDTSGL